MYKVNKKYITNNMIFPSIMLVLFIVFAIFMIYFESLEKEGYGYFVSIIALVFMYICIRFIKKWGKKLAEVKYLEENGKLVKDLSYDIVKYLSSSSDGIDTYLYHAIVKYKFDNKEVELISHDYTSDKVLVNNKYIDLIYDEKDTSKYYLEFNIEKEGEK